MIVTVRGGPVDQTARVESKTPTGDKNQREPARSETHARPTTPRQSTFAQVSGSIERAGRESLTGDETRRASRTGWDQMADAYQAEHGRDLGPAQLLWCPEGLTEAEARLLAPVEGQRVLEVGCGAGQASRWVVEQGGLPTGIDLSAAQLQHGRRLDHETGSSVRTVQADAVRLPFRDRTFDLAFSANGAVSFVDDVVALFGEVARVLTRGGRWVFSVPHPIRWSFPDDPSPNGLTARSSYWDRTPYVERDAAGHAVYVEHHRTLGDQVRALHATGFVLVDLVEPTWPPERTTIWGGWSPLRGAVVPGTAIFCCRLG